MENPRVIDLRTRAGYRPSYAALARSQILLARNSLGMTPAEFAEHLSGILEWPVSASAVESWETSTVPPGDALMAATAIHPPDCAETSIRSHKFIPAYIGHLAAGLSDTIDVPHESGTCTLHARACGTVVYHLVEELTLPNLAALALWRYPSYERDLAWATRHLQEHLGAQEVAASYVLSMYWSHEPIWAGALLNNAVRIMASPRLLIDHETADPDEQRHAAEQVERELLADGLDAGDAFPFGMSSVSIGYASWSGVAYHALDPGRALTEAELVDCELDVQSAWMLCDHINSEAERGAEPTVPRGYGWRYLRSVRSALTNPRPQETGQHRSMRDAIVASSSVLGHLDQAIEVLREAGVK